MSNYPQICIGHSAAGTEGACKNLTGYKSGRGRQNPYWCPSCDEARIKHISAAFDKLAALQTPKTEGGDA